MEIAAMLIHIYIATRQIIQVTTPWKWLICIRLAILPMIGNIIIFSLTAKTFKRNFLKLAKKGKVVSILVKIGAIVIVIADIGIFLQFNLLVFPTFMPIPFIAFFVTMLFQISIDRFFIKLKFALEGKDEKGVPFALATVSQQ
jgi:hypothetical protein